MTWIQPVTLRGAGVTLEPLAHVHHDDLAAAANDGDAWRQWTTSIPKPDEMKAEIDRRLSLRAAGTMLPFAVLDAGGRAVGMTSYMDIDAANRRVEIGSTWYRPSVRRTGLNTEAKRLLLTHAFEALDAVAVEFRTHFFNHASRTAIERLGAKLDGVLRNHRLGPEGTIRDSCSYSIIAGEWPTVKVHLAHLQRRYER
ncbi:MAG TPA: GNAT family N-acetyltransferase [Candidatus Baltobacteraceae bacterium]|nr:GNAT family N-acetyltransferase [Candidatus Baltobacteraceae bacterium]